MGIPRLCRVLDRNSIRGKRSYRRIRNPYYFSFAYRLPCCDFYCLRFHLCRPLRRFCRLGHFRHLRRFCCLAVVAASAIAVMFPIPLISCRFVLTAGDLDFTVFLGRVSCAGAKVASDEGCIVAAVTTGGQHRSAPGGRFLAFQPLILVYHSTLDPFPRGPIR